MMFLTYIIYSFTLFLSIGLSYFQTNLKGITNHINSYKIISLLPIILISSLRSNSVGTDTENYYIIFTEIIEPTIGINEPCFVYNFPRQQASLAKVSEQDVRVAERFECYYRGIELVNGFNELTDANEQQKRFDQDNVKRVTQGLPPRSIDENFMAALNHGLPQCSGVALGVDRLVIIALRCKHINETISFVSGKA